MATGDIRPKDLTRVTSLEDGDSFLIDGATTRSIDASDLVTSREDARAGADNSKFMTALTVADLVGGARLLTKAAAESAMISPSFTSLRLDGYSMMGDAGRSNWVRVASEPTTRGGKFRSSDRFMPDGSINATNGGWWQLAEVEPDITMFGAVDGQNCDSAIMDAVEYINTVYVNVGGSFDAWTAGVITLPKGVFKVSHSTLDFTGSMRLTLRGQGGRMFNFYKQAPTVILIDGTGSDTSSFGMKVTVNTARGFLLEDLSIEYENSFAGNLLYTDAPGLMMNRVSMGSSALSGVRPKTANSLIYATAAHHFNIISCCFSDADTGLYLQGQNTTQWNVNGCAFYDFTTAAVQDLGTTNSGLSFTGCMFDPIQSSPAYALMIASPGFSVSGCFFGGSTADFSPTTAWIRTDINATGSISGNYFLSQVDGSVVLRMVGGSVDFTGNTSVATGGIYCSGTNTCLTGENNKWIHQSAGGVTTDVAVKLNQTGGFVDYGPDTFGSGYQRSFLVTDNGNAFCGQVRWAQANDQTTLGPSWGTVASGKVKLIPMQHDEDTTTAAKTLSLRDMGKKFKKSGTWTLPSASGIPNGMQVSFLKVETGALTITAPAGVTIFDGSGASVSSISNGTSEVGSMVTLESSSGSQWWLKDVTGTWTDPTWATYTPTFTAGSGTITTATATGRYKQIGKTVFVEFNVAITTAGTGAGNLVVSLPVAVNTNYNGALSGSLSSATLCGALVRPGSFGNNAVVLKYDATTVIANSANVFVSGVYEAA